MKTVVCFGEVMGRLCPPGFHRLRQALPGMLEFTFAGAEVNVAVSIAHLGGSARFVTALPDNALTEACIANLRGFGVDTEFVIRSEQGRFGLYFYEHGVDHRPGRVVYDRGHSSVSIASGETYPWPAIFENAGWFHLSGVTPALSRTAAQASLKALREAKAAGCRVSYDVNFRGKLWRWEPESAPRELSARTSREILPFVDVLIASEEDIRDFLRLAPDPAPAMPESFQALAALLAEQFPNIQQIAATRRESLSPSVQRWGAVLYDAGRKQLHAAPMRNGSHAPYEIHRIVDRLGAGDAFAAGLIHGLHTAGLPGPDALAFATAASCLAHSIHGDFNLTPLSEIESLIRETDAGRIDR